MNPNIFFISLFTESISSFSQSPCYSPNPSTAENVYNYKPTQRSKHFLLVYYLKYRTETPLLDNSGLGFWVSIYPSGKNISWELMMSFAGKVACRLEIELRGVHGGGMG